MATLDSIPISQNNTSPKEYSTFSGRYQINCFFPFCGMVSALPWLVSPDKFRDLIVKDTVIYTYHLGLFFGGKRTKRPQQHKCSRPQKLLWQKSGELSLGYQVFKLVTGPIIVMINTAVKPHILECISDGVFTVNRDWRITSFNRAAEEITGLSRSEAIGCYCWDVFRSNVCKGDCPMRKTMKEGRSFVNVSAYITNKNNKRVPISVSTAVLHNSQGEILGGVETFRDNSVVDELRRELDGSFRQGDMVSRSHLMKKIFMVLPKIAKSESTVLIEGDTGTGKEILAKALHDLSLRRDKPFVAINCGALPDTLLESELFGYKAGAFTDAVSDKPGYFSMAEGGTIMLDELGETSAAFQAKLLRVLEEREYQPLGGVQKQHANVRILAATNRDLESLIELGRFRQDLFYRINIVRLQLPPLKERKEDIPLLIDRFIEKLNRLQNKSVSSVDDEALKWLMNYDYPGNIRQLENIIEHAFILCSHGKIGTQHLPGYLEFTPRPTSPVLSSIQTIRQSTEEDAILQALQRNGYNRLAAAKELGMHKTTLFRKIKKLKIRLPGTDGRSGSPSKSAHDSN